MISYYFEVLRKDVVDLAAILESYEGLCCVRNPHPTKGEEKTILHIMTTTDRKKEFQQAVQTLKKKFKMKLLKKE